MHVGRDMTHYLRMDARVFTVDVTLVISPGVHESSVTQLFSASSSCSRILYEPLAISIISHSFRYAIRVSVRDSFQCEIRSARDSFRRDSFRFVSLTYTITSISKQLIN